MQFQFFATITAIIHWKVQYSLGLGHSLTYSVTKSHNNGIKHNASPIMHSWSHLRSTHATPMPLMSTQTPLPMLIHNSLLFFSLLNVWLANKIIDWRIKIVANLPLSTTDSDHRIITSAYSAEADTADTFAKEWMRCAIIIDSSRGSCFFCL